MLAFERKESGLMLRAPRRPRSPLLSKELIARIVLTGLLLMAAAFGLFEWEEMTGASHAQARTVAVNAFAAISSLYLLNCRSLHRPYWTLGIFTNPLLLAGIALMALMQIAFTYLPFMNGLFHTAPIGGDSWLRIGAAALLAHAAIGLEKTIAGRASRP
jgi:magnesium-transporting ATPase (P-type)